VTEEELLAYYERYPSERADAVKRIVRERDALRARVARENHDQNDTED